MARCRAPCGTVIHVDLVECERPQFLFGSRRGLQAHHRDAPCDQGAQLRHINMKECGDHTVDSTLFDKSQALDFLLGYTVGVVDGDLVAIAFGDILQAAHESRVKRIGDGWNDAGNGVGLSRAQRTRHAVGLVPELDDRVEHALPCRLGHRDRGVLVQHVGHHRLRDVGQPCHIGLRGPFVACSVNHHAAPASQGCQRRCSLDLGIWL